MAAQQTLIAETIRAMKLALKRKADDSDSDTPIQAPTNRGNKLKRNAKHVREGRLDNTGGLSYKKRISHAGCTRTLISTNPPLFDDDGDLVQASDSEADASPVEDDPFGQTQLEHLLAPLTAASNLADHPSLSVAYKSKALTQMADDALATARREKESLWRMKKLLVRFRGDAPWMPGATFETQHDELLLQVDGLGTGFSAGNSVITTATDHEMQSISAVPSYEMGEANKLGVRPGKVGEIGDADAMEGVEVVDLAPAGAAPMSEAPLAEPEVRENGNTGIKPDQEGEGEQIAQDSTERPPHAKLVNAQSASAAGSRELRNPTLDEIGRSIEPASGSTSNSGNAPSHQMTTRARARSPMRTPSPSPSPSDSASIPAVHPWFLVPPACHPDRDFGLLPQEAEDTRKLLLLYVQKQEQIVREAGALADGLLKADRLRKSVYSWCKAEGHVGPDGRTEMSDGEDWYDVEDWGLELDLVKGKEDVEEEEEGRRGGRRRRVQRL